MPEKRIRELKNKQKLYERKYGNGVKPRVQVGPVTYIVLAISAVATLAMLYLSQANKLATQGYDLDDLKTELSELEAENEHLTVEITRLKSVNEAAKETNKQDAGLQGMVASRSVTYVPSTSGAVAKR